MAARGSDKTERARVGLFLAAYTGIGAFLATWASDRLFAGGIGDLSFDLIVHFESLKIGL